MLFDRLAPDDEVYCQFLRSELYRFHDHPACQQVAALVNKPDFDDINQNTARHIFLFSERSPVLSKLPRDLRWYRGTMQLGDLERLRLIAGNCGWQDKATDNLLGNIDFPRAFDRIGLEK
jgi:hypothetical protein